MVDAGQCRENLRAGVFLLHGAARAFQRAHGFVAIDGHDEGVPARAGGCEVANVPGVKEIEAAIGEDDASSFALGTPNPDADPGQRTDFREVRGR